MYPFEQNKQPKLTMLRIKFQKQDGNKVRFSGKLTNIILQDFDMPLKEYLITKFKDLEQECGFKVYIEEEK